MKVIIFDLFGTLVKPESDRLAHQELADYLSREYGVSKQAFLSLYDELESRGELPGDAVARTIQQLLPGLKEEELKGILRKHAELHAAFTIPYEDTERAVSVAKERIGHVAVVTDAGRDVAELVLASLGVLPLIDVIVTSEDVGERKPSPKPYLKALELLGTQPDDAVSIGDSCKDLESSRSAGVRAVLVRRISSELGCEGMASAVATSVLEAVEKAVNLLLGQ